MKTHSLANYADNLHQPFKRFLGFTLELFVVARNVAGVPVTSGGRLVMAQSRAKSSRT